MFKKFNRLTALAALLTALGVLLGSCGDTSGKDPVVSSDGAATTAAVTEDLYDENGLLKDDLPESMNFDSDVNVLGCKTSRT